MAVARRSRGTRVPASSRPSAMGRVSSKTASLVKLRMAKLSSCAMGEGLAVPAASMREMERVRRYTFARYRVLCARRKAGLVFRWPLDVVDGEDVDGAEGAFELQAQLFLDGGGEGGVAFRVGGLEGEVVPGGQASLVLDGALEHGTQKAGNAFCGEVADGHDVAVGIHAGLDVGPSGFGRGRVGDGGVDGFDFGGLEL